MGDKKNVKSEEVARRLKAVIETASDCIVIIDERGKVETINKTGADLFQYAIGEVVGNNVSMLMPEPDKSLHDSYLRNYLETGDAKIIGIGREVSGRKKDGTIFPLRLAVSEVNLDSGERAFTGIIHDLTEMKEAERKIISLNEELEEKVIGRTEELAQVVNRLLSVNKRLEQEIAERRKIEQQLNDKQEELHKSLEKERELGELKSRFVSMASHEFRTPLSTILSSAALMRRYTETEQQLNREKHILRIKSAVENLNGILNDFLSISKLDEGRIQSNLDEVDLEEFLPEIMEELELSLKNNQQIILSNKVKGTIFSDKQILKNIILNLMSNAIKYSEENTSIHLECRIEDDNLLIEVIDEGIGIPPEDQRHLFSRFFRASNAINIKGTGLGLTIVNTYLELLGGSINFDSQLGKGSTFTIYLPQKTEKNEKDSRH